MRFPTHPMRKLASPRARRGSSNSAPTTPAAPRRGSGSFAMPQCLRIAVGMSRLFRRERRRARALVTETRRERSLYASWSLGGLAPPLGKQERARGDDEQTQERPTRRLGAGNGKAAVGDRVVAAALDGVATVGSAGVGVVADQRRSSHTDARLENLVAVAEIAVGTRNAVEDLLSRALGSVAAADLGDIAGARRGETHGGKAAVE